MLLAVVLQGVKRAGHWVNLSTDRQAGINYNLHFEGNVNYIISYCDLAMHWFTFGVLFHFRFGFSFIMSCFGARGPFCVAAHVVKNYTHSTRRDLPISFQSN